ncbi:MAG: sugar epimerase [Bacteroidota bacterium]
MTPIKRFYSITHPDTITCRGWRGHQIEQRWFKVLDGEFLISLVKIDNWDFPTKETTFDNFKLSAELTEILHVPCGYASLIRAIKENSKLLVFADYGIEHATVDDYIYPENYFIETK